MSTEREQNVLVDEMVGQVAAVITSNTTAASGDAEEAAWDVVRAVGVALAANLRREALGLGRDDHRSGLLSAAGHVEFWTSVSEHPDPT